MVTFGRVVLAACWLLLLSAKACLTEMPEAFLPRHTSIASRKLLQNAATPGVYTLYSGTNYTPGDYDCAGTIRRGYCNFNGSPGDAKYRCDSQPGCQGFVYIVGPSAEFYYLKGGPNSQPLDLDSKSCDAGTDFYAKQPISGVAPAPYSIYRMSNYQLGDFNCPGTQQQGYCRFVGSPSVAEAKCSSTAGCRGFVFVLDPQGSFFYLKGGQGSGPIDLTRKSCDPATDLYVAQPAGLTMAPQAAMAPTASGRLNAMAAAAPLAGTWWGTTASPAAMVLTGASLAGVACMDTALASRFRFSAQFIKANLLNTTQVYSISGTSVDLSIIDAGVSQGILETNSKAPQYATLVPFALGSLRRHYTIAAGHPGYGNLVVLQTDAAGQPDWCWQWSTAYNSVSKTVVAVIIEQFAVQPVGLFGVPVLHPICNAPKTLPATTVASCNRTTPLQNIQYDPESIPLKIDFNLSTVPPLPQQGLLQATPDFGQNAFLPLPSLITLRTELTCVAGACLNLFP